ncbi:MAG: DUF2490 domain-containing protein [Bacteroidaceae bacterium]|nr:DUF2490 domain-containing protein [Bacteroidaceae bacterium]
MKRILFILSLVVTGSPMLAQEDYVSEDAGKSTSALWSELGFTKILPHDLTLGLDAGFRTNEGFSEASRFDIGLGLGWKPSKHWKLGVGYTFVMKHYPVETAHKEDYEYKYRADGASENTDFSSFMGAPTITDNGTNYTYKGYNYEYFTRVTDSYWRPKHRISADVAYSYKFWKILRVSLRERYQLSLVPSKTVNRKRTKVTTKYRDPVYDGYPLEFTGEYDDIETYDPEELDTTKVKDSKALHTLRSRLTLELDKKGWAVTPFIYCELFNDLAGNFRIDKVRASAGIEYAVSPRHKLSFAYVFNNENDDDGHYKIHALNIGYKFKF